MTPPLSLNPPPLVPADRQPAGADSAWPALWSLAIVAVVALTLVMLATTQKTPTVASANMSSSAPVTIPVAE